MAEEMEPGRADEKEYIVLTKIHFEDKWHDIGSHVSMTEAEAQKFLLANAIREKELVKVTTEGGGERHVYLSKSDHDEMTDD